LWSSYLLSLCFDSSFVLLVLCMRFILEMGCLIKITIWIMSGGK